MIGRIGILFFVGLGFVCVACGSSDDDGKGSGQASSGSTCEQACDKLKSCNTGMTTCQITGECSGQSEQVAECILTKDCNETSTCFL